MRDELSVTKEGTVLRNRRILIPKALRERIVILAQRRHRQFHEEARKSHLNRKNSHGAKTESHGD